MLNINITHNRVGKIFRYSNIQKIRTSFNKLHIEFILFPSNVIDVRLFVLVNHRNFYIFSRMIIGFIPFNSYFFFNCFFVDDNRCMLCFGGFIMFRYNFSNMLCSASLHTELCTQTLITPLYIFYYILQQKNFLFHLSAPLHCLRTRSMLHQTRIESKKGLFKDLFYSLTTPETDNRKIRICTLFWNHNILSIYDLNNHHNFKY